MYKSTIENNREQPLNNGYHNYWTTKEQKKSQVKQQVSYDDILSTLNLTEVNGVLIFKENKEEKEKEKEKEKEPLKNAKPVNIPIPQEITNSYIYNKFFKKYKSADVVETPQVPLTKEEYIKSKIKKHNERVAAQKRIEQIKSKKLLFVSGNNTVNNIINTKTNKMFNF
jgi:hypothetical protein